MIGIRSTIERFLSSATDPKIYDVAVIGGGAAGVGVSVTLRHAGIENFVVLERDSVGASFASWPAETRFITPSFPTNSIGMIDLNSIAIGVSPAFSLQVEHPTGALTVIAEMDGDVVGKAGILRTARKLMDGVVFPHA